MLVALVETEKARVHTYSYIPTHVCAYVYAKLQCVTIDRVRRNNSEAREGRNFSNEVIGKDVKLQST